MKQQAVPALDLIKEIKEKEYLWCGDILKDLVTKNS